MISSLVNGELSAHVDVTDRGLAYGDGIFETIVVEGGRPQLWQEHMDRLRLGCERLGMAMTPQEIWLRELHTTAAGSPACLVKLMQTRGTGGRGYSPADSSQPTRIVTAWPIPDGIEADRRNGVHGRVCEMRVALQPALRGMKHLNRLEQVLAASEMRNHPGKEGILLNTEDYVIGAIQANLFAVTGDLLLTPRMDRCGVHGVLRERMLKVFKLRCERRRITLNLLQDSDEVFLCSTVRGIVPLLSIDELQWPAGPETRRMQEWHRDLGAQN